VTADYADYFRSAMRECASAIDDFMGERVIVFATEGKPNFQKTRISGKEIETVAAFTWISKTVFGGKGKAYGSGGADFMLPVESREPRFSFNVNNLPWPILRGYQIQRRVDATLWDVTGAKPDGVSRTCVEVVQLGLSTQ
jgi:hypothetical protein